MSQISSSRRRFLTALGAGVTGLPLIALPGFVRAATASVPEGNMLVLIELVGGNDGLNTVVPVSDPKYHSLRPEIGLKRHEVLRLDDETGLHPAMRGFADLWQDGHAQIIEGVGYPEPNRSHFRSIEIWNSGLGTREKGRDGWVASAFADGPPAGSDIEGIVLGGDMGPLAGPGRFTAMRDTTEFMDTIGNLSAAPHAVRRQANLSPLEHVLATYDSAFITGDAISRRLEASRDKGWSFPDTELGNQLHTAARLLDAGVSVPVLKVVQSGYDTHDGQPDRHAKLLGDLCAAITAFASAAKDMGRWQQITLLTYSEFGRTARENASAGTDHGTAAPVLLVGGQVMAGRSGQRPSLDALVDGEMAFTTDYRSLYAGVLRDLWSIDAPMFDLAGAARLRVRQG